jgi:hypothetical protein
LARLDTLTRVQEAVVLEDGGWQLLFLPERSATQKLLKSQQKTCSIQICFTNTRSKTSFDKKIYIVPLLVFPNVQTGRSVFLHKYVL